MSKIVLISCVGKKLFHKAKAENLYISPLFKYNLRYAKQFNPDKIFILSAKYGLVDTQRIIAPYDETLNWLSASEIKVWADGVLKDLRNVCDLTTDEFVFLAGEKYRRYLEPHIYHCQVPLHGLTIGRQLSFLRKAINP